MNNTSFLNVDFEVWSRDPTHGNSTIPGSIEVGHNEQSNHASNYDATKQIASLQEFIKVLDGELMVITLEDESVTLELTWTPKTIDEAIAAIHDIICSSNEYAKKFWHACAKRQANVGIQAGYSPHQLCLDVSSKSLAYLQQLEMSLSITVYSCRKK